MDTVEPIITDAFRLLRADLYAHLEEAEALATKTDVWSDQDVDAAHELISDLLVVVRGCLPVRDPQAPYLLLSVPNGDHEADETAHPRLHRDQDRRHVRSRQWDAHPCGARSNFCGQ